MAKYKEERERLLHAHRDKRSWCRGKKGVEHDLYASKEVVSRLWSSTFNWKLRCQKCGKVLETYWYFMKKKNKPDWVPEDE